MRICTFDIETSALEAVGAGFVLCAVVKPLDDKPIVLRYDMMSCSPGQEKPLLRKLADLLSGFHLWVAHNGENFDYKYLKSRIIQLELPNLPKPFIYDTMKAFRRTGYRTVDNGFGKPTASLAMVADFFGIKQEKTALYPREHWKTVWQTGKERRAAMDKLVAHCLADVSLNEQVYWKLLEVDSVWGLRRAN